MFQKDKNAFWTPKLNFQKSTKNRHFPKGLVHAFWLKLAPFLISCFSANQARGERFSIIQTEKNAFQATKVTFQKSSKNRNFPKGLVHAFWLQLTPFLISCFSANQTSGERFSMFQIEKNAFKTTTVHFEKTPKSRNFPKGLAHAFWLKLTAFLISYF